MKRAMWVWISAFMFASALSPAIWIRYEAENAVLTDGVVVGADAGASGGAYAAINSGTITFNINVREAKTYNMRIRHASNSEGWQDILLNEVEYCDQQFGCPAGYDLKTKTLTDHNWDNKFGVPAWESEWDEFSASIVTDAGTPNTWQLVDKWASKWQYNRMNIPMTVPLESGINSIAIDSIWGNSIYDFIELDMAPAAVVVNPADGGETNDLLTSISWQAPVEATKAEVYFGSTEPNYENYTTVLTAAETVTYPSGQISTDIPAAFLPLSNGTTYYWLVDCYGGDPLAAEPNLPGILWSFTVKNVQITSIIQNTSTVDLYEKFESTFTLNKAYSNPFDLEVIDITAIVTQPDNSTITVPAFFSREYDVVGSSPEIYQNPGPEQWKIRFAPSMPGMYSYDIYVNEGGTPSQFEGMGTFTCTQSEGKGFVRRDTEDDLCLRYDDGSPRINLGHNVCWESTELAGCQNYFTNMAAVGENWTRIWMCPWGNDGWVMLEYASDHWSGNFSGVGSYSLETAQRLDSIVELAEQLGISIQLVLEYHGLYSTTTNSNWSSNPYNAARPEDGGFLLNPEDFFSDTEAKRLTKNKYRYIIARWGYSPAILAWELWNEVQFTDGWSNTQSDVIAWHQEMSDFIRSVDPHGHLITTSSNSSGFENIWNLSSIDLIQVHHYGTPVISPFNTTPRELGQLFQKPVIIGEFGAGRVDGNDAHSETYIVDLPEPYHSQILDGLVLHNGIWSAFHARSSAHLWWWDLYIDPYNQYPIFEPLAAYAQGEDIRSMQPAERAVEGFQSYYANPQIGDFWHIHTQTHFYLDNDYFPGMGLLSKYLQGIWQNDYRSDPTFHLTMPEAGYLFIHVNTVSAAGNNSLRVLVDSVEVFSSSYVAGASNFTISVPLPAGDIAVQVENTGQDWFDITSYEFSPGTTSLLGSVGLRNNTRALIWVYDINSQYGDTPSGVFSEEPFYVYDLQNGEYDVVFYETRGVGGVIETQRVSSEAGLLSCTIPDFTQDIAIKVRKACLVGLDDLVALATYWLMNGPDIPADFDGDTHVDLNDYALLSSHWLDDCPTGWPLP